LLVAALVIGAGVAYWFTLAPTPQRTDLLFHKVRYEPMNLTVVERGTLESADNREVVCRVKAGTKTTALNIKWVIDDGAQVKTGERLMEIDDSALQDQLKVQKIVLDQARAAWIAAEENFKVVRSQNEGAIANAEIAVILADLDLKKYLEGDYEREKKSILGLLELAKSNLEIQRERVAWAERASTRDYLSDGQYKAEQAKLASARNELKNQEEQLRVLDEYTKVRMVTQYENAKIDTKRALERAKNEARAKEITAESDRQAKKSVYEQEEEKYLDIEDQIRKCIITSPQDGMVVYFISDQSRWGSGSQQAIVAQGEPVKEGQKLMRIPDLKRMLVNTKVHEAMISRIKGDVWKPTGFSDVLRASLMMQPDGLSRLVNLNAMAEIRDRFREHELEKVSDGLRATVRVEAFPDRLLQGHVKSVATVAAQQDWMSADIKNYQTMVSIDESLEGLKPGMSAEVTIHIESTEDHVLTVPIQAVFGGVELGRQRKLFVNTPEGPRERDVTIGLANEKIVEIKDGLKEGETVILNPKAILGDKVKTRQVIDNERGGAGGGNGKGRGKGRPPMDKSGEMTLPGMGKGDYPGAGGGAPPGGGGAPNVEKK
jgi:HlyD family secretion protein